MHFSLRSGVCLGAGLLSCGAAISLSVVDAAAKSAATCTASHSPAGVPVLSVSSSRSPRVSGSVLVSAGTSRVTLATSGAARVRRAARTPAGQASLEFCLRAGRVRRSATLVKVAPGGLSVSFTSRHRLALSHPAGRRTATSTVALAGNAELVDVVVQRSRSRTTLRVNGANRASARAAIASQARIYLTAGSGRSVAAPITVSGTSAAVFPSPAPRSTASASSPISAPAPPTAAATPAPPPTTAPAASPPTTAPATTTTSALPTTPAPSTTVTPAPTTTTTSAPPSTTTASPPESTTTTAPTSTDAPGITAAAASAVPFSPFSPTSFWNAPLPANAPIDPNSQTYVNDLISQINQRGLWMNTDQYSTPVYVVPADQPTVKVALGNWGPDLQQQFDAVPIPAGATAAAGTDEHMTVWQPSTDKLWEFWQMRQVNGAWTAVWGGEMDSVSTSPGYFTHSGQTTNWGATATGLPLLGGLITTADLQRGYINHALAIAVPQTKAGVFTWPAQRTDGTSTAATALPEGIRFRFNPDVDVASLGFPYLDRLILQAMQTYGFVVRDTSGCVCFYGQDLTPAHTNPFGPLWDNWAEGTYLSWLPWSQMEALQTQLKG